MIARSLLGAPGRPFPATTSFAGAAQLAAVFPTQIVASASRHASIRAR
jgi:hypothetical protein